MKFRQFGGAKKIASGLLNIIKSLFLFLGRFFIRAFHSIKLMSKKEKITALLLFAVLAILIFFKGRELYVKETVEIPAFGGEYIEATVGDYKYSNPILAKSDAERSISRLVYSGLVKLDAKGQIIPDLARDWQISEDGLTYQFNLLENVVFQNGQQFTSADVKATIDLIKDAKNKSPQYEVWREIGVSTPSDKVVEFKLPRQYGPFIYNCLQGVISANDANISLAQINNGTGPYKIVQTKPITSEKFVSVELASNSNYYDVTPLISSLAFRVYPEANQVIIGKSLADFTAVSGRSIENGKFQNMSFETGRRLVLLPNLRKGFLANDDNRKKILNFEKFESKVKLTLIALDADEQKAKIEEIKKQIADKNIEIDFKILPAVEFNEAVKKRDFDLLLYGCDFGYDRDLYSFWHSSQINSNNFSGYSNKSSDILLEDARLLSDPTERNKKYDEFITKIKEQNLAIIYPQVKYDFAVRPEVRGLDYIVGSRPEDRFNSITSWYIETKRIKKVDEQS